MEGHFSHTNSAPTHVHALFERLTLEPEEPTAGAAAEEEECEPRSTEQALRRPGLQRRVLVTAV